MLLTTKYLYRHDSRFLSVDFDAPFVNIISSQYLLERFCSFLDKEDLLHVSLTCRFITSQMRSWRHREVLMRNDDDDKNDRKDISNSSRSYQFILRSHNTKVDGFGIDFHTIKTKLQRRNFIKIVSPICDTICSIKAAIPLLRRKYQRIPDNHVDIHENYYHRYWMYMLLVMLGLCVIVALMLLYWF
jgi:hypothetical protein